MESFDLRTHIRDPKTHKIVEIKAYRLHILNGKRYFERPSGSGEFYFEGGERAENPFAQPEVKPAEVVAELNQVKEVIKEADKVVAAASKKASGGEKFFNKKG